MLRGPCDDVLPAEGTPHGMDPMHPQNRPIADAFLRIADLLELQRADPVRIRAYRKASSALGTLGTSVRAMRHRGEDLRAVPGIGEGLAATVEELAERGSCALLERLDDAIPQDLSVLLGLAHLGPQRVRTLHEELGVRTVEQLHAAALAGRLQALAGFGPRLEHQLLKATTDALSRERRFRVDTAHAAADALSAWLRAQPGVSRVEPSGSLRRGRDSVSRVSLLVESMRDRDLVAAFASHPDVREVSSSGLARIDATIKGGLAVTVEVAVPERFGAAWLDATGARAHLRAISRIALRHRMALDARGLVQSGRLVAALDETAIFSALGLPFIPPELREDRGEVEAAEAGRLPALVERAQLRGDLKLRTRDARGHDLPVDALAARAHARGLQYVALADHARRLDRARDNDLDRIARQVDEIDRLNAAHPGFVILKGAHVDILEDGSLNVPDAMLARLDLVIGALAPPYDLTRRRQTERLMRAMDNRCFSILGEPTARLIEERGPCLIDLRRVLRHARERGCFVELDSRPARLDLDDGGCRLAKAEGVLVAIVSAARGEEELENLGFGIAQARRGWLEADDVLNTRPVDEVRALLAPTMRR
jgi:DNA polymerase (family 10)